MSFISAFNGILWNYTIIILLIAVGVVYTIGLKFPQIRFFKNMFRSVLKEGTKKKSGINSFATACTAIGGQVGTGNLAGVATAIASGGPGAVFWMWIIGIIGMATSFAEAVLAQLFREKNDDGTYVGGPAYYLSKGVGGKLGRVLGVFISIVMVVACGFIVSPLQINSIVDGFSGVFTIPRVLLGIVFAILTALVVFGGIRRISGVAKYVVPVMSVMYILVALVCVVLNIGKLPAVFALIIKSAFGVEAVAGGAVGYTVKQAFRYGCARGMFSNEAGEGTTPAVHATADVNHPADQGFAGMFGVFVDTLVICTATAFIVLFTKSNELGLTGIVLTQTAIGSVIGSVGPYFILVCIILFAWTSCLANIYYGETCICWLNIKNKSLLMVYRAICVVLLIGGALVNADVMWEIADFVNAFLVLPNGIGLLLMCPLVFGIAKDYQRQRADGIDIPKWDYSQDPKSLRVKK